MFLLPLILSLALTITLTLALTLYLGRTMPQFGSNCVAVREPLCRASQPPPALKSQESYNAHASWPMPYALCPMPPARKSQPTMSIVHHYHEPSNHKSPTTVPHVNYE